MTIYIFLVIFVTLLFLRHSSSCAAMRVWAVDDGIKINPQTGKAFEDSEIYPGDFVGFDGPVPCIRLKLLRRGSQDFEYMWLLAQLRDDKSAIDKIVNSVLFRAMHEALKPGQDYWEPRERDSRSHNPAQWDDARNKLVQAILNSAGG